MSKFDRFLHDYFVPGVVGLIIILISVGLLRFMTSV